MSQDIISKLNEIKDIKQLIKQAIIEKGVEIIDTDLFSDYATRIAEIQVGIDTKDATALANDILANKTAYVNDVKVTGTMPNNTSTTKVLTTKDTTYTIPGGHHDGTGIIKVVPEVKNVTPTKAAQNIVASEGKVLSNVNVAAIPNNFTDSSDADAIAANIVSGKTVYVNGVKITGTMKQITHAKPTISRDGGTVTATHVQGDGYCSGGTTTETLSIPTEAGKTITPSTTSKTAIASGKLATGNILVSGDANLIARNIKKNVSIFGVNGTYEGSGSALTPYEITLQSKNAYIKNAYYTDSTGQLTKILIIGSTDINKKLTTYGSIVVEAYGTYLNIDISGGQETKFTSATLTTTIDTSQRNGYIYIISPPFDKTVVISSPQASTQPPGGGTSTI